MHTKSIITTLLFSLLLLSCSSDEEKILDCYEDNVTESLLDELSETASVFATDPTNKAACEAYADIVIKWVDELEDYANCVKANGTALRAGFEDIDSQIEALRETRNSISCD